MEKIDPFSQQLFSGTWEAPNNDLIKDNGGVYKVDKDKEAYATELVEAMMPDSSEMEPSPIESTSPLHNSTNNTPKSGKNILKSFSELAYVRNQFPKKDDAQKTEKTPQDLGAMATKKERMWIPHAINSQIDRMNEDLKDSKERLEKMIKGKGPKKGIEYYKQKISFYESEIIKAEDARNKAKAENQNKKQTIEIKKDDAKIQKEIGEQLNLIDSGENQIRYVDNAPKMDAFKRATLKDLSESDKTEGIDIAGLSNLEEEEVDILLKDALVNKEEESQETSAPMIVEAFDKGWYGKAEELEMHKFGQAFETFDQNTDKKIEQHGNWVLEKARSAGEWYKKQPLKYKILLSAGLLISASAPAVLAGAAVSTIATAAFAGSIGQRALGGLATFVAAEAWLKKSAEKGGVERTKAEATRHTIEAAILGTLVGSGYVAKGLKNIADATGLTTLITDAYHYWLPTEDVAKIMEANGTPLPTEQIAPTATPEAPGVKLDISDTLDVPEPETPHLDIDTGLNTTATPLETSTLSAVEGATKEVLERGLTTDFSVELGKNGIPTSLERVFHMMAVNNMGLKDIVIFGEADGAKSLNIAANLVKLAEGHNLADVDNLSGISASDFNNAVTWDQAKNILTIKDHGAFNKIVENLGGRADTLWDQGVLQKGSVAYLNDIKPETWTEILHADPLEKVGDIETGIIGHDDITPNQITDFDNSEMVKTADEAQRKIAERLEALRNELNANPEPIKGTTYTVTGADKTTPAGDWVSTKEAPSANGAEVIENATPIKIPAKDALESLSNYNVNKIMNHDIDGLFGKKGFFGFGAKSGLESPEWLKAKGLPVNKASGALKNYIENLKVHTRVAPQANETTEGYIKRAIAHFIKDDEWLKTPLTTVAPTPEVFTPSETLTAPTSPTSAPEVFGEPKVTPIPTPPLETIPKPPIASVETVTHQSTGPTVYGTPEAHLPPKNSGTVWFGENNNK